MPTSLLDATPAGPAANSYLTVAEADAYYATRVALNPAWEDADSKETLLIMATRQLDASFYGTKRLVVAATPYYLIGRKWTGAPSTTTQRLSWPRQVMNDANGNVIDALVIPEDLKFATAEFAGQLGIGDRTLDNDVIVQGLKSVKAGSVALSFKDNFNPQVLPDAVVNLLVPSWYTEEDYQNANQALFDVVSGY